MTKRGLLDRIASAYLGLRSRPFAGAFALLVFVGGLYGLLGIGLSADALAGLVEPWLLKVMSAIYMLSGFLLLVGFMFHRRNLEAGGCIGTIAGLLARMFALVVAYGFTLPVTATLVFYLGAGLSCVERLRQIAQHEDIVIVERPPAADV